VKHLAPNAN